MQGYRSITSPVSNSANLCSSQAPLGLPGSCLRLLCHCSCTGTDGEQGWRAELGTKLQGLLWIPNYSTRTTQTCGWTEQCCNTARATPASSTTTPKPAGQKSSRQTIASHTLGLGLGVRVNSTPVPWTSHTQATLDATTELSLSSLKQPQVAGLCESTVQIILLVQSGV